MSYHTKEQVSEYINVSCQTIAKEKHSPITDPQKALKELTDEQDLVGFFWIEAANSGENTVGIKMGGKIFVRLDSNTYCDDRFAVDAYHAQKEGVAVTDIIKKREDEQKNAASQMTPEILDSLKGFLQHKQ